MRHINWNLAVNHTTEGTDRAHCSSKLERGLWRLGNDDMSFSTRSSFEPPACPPVGTLGCVGLTNDAHFDRVVKSTKSLLLRREQLCGRTETTSAGETPHMPSSPTRTQAHHHPRPRYDNAE
ncbi:hypothetical protein HPB52_014297 [Rhipicephalus sanguineus]|uniref:Uncharacterized protein n=1 Tax=Rhipicephalus sanguineus TaxID=34632 RepID=A0A9D4QG45_RHISA|nr:hypothetical protein HPB52_014297 [Rhipicephalus sanguineus]